MTGKLPIFVNIDGKWKTLPYIPHLQKFEDGQIGIELPFHDWMECRVTGVQAYDPHFKEKFDALRTLNAAIRIDADASHSYSEWRGTIRWVIVTENFVRKLYPIDPGHQPISATKLGLNFFSWLNYALCAASFYETGIWEYIMPWAMVAAVVATAFLVVFLVAELFRGP